MNNSSRGRHTPLLLHDLHRRWRRRLRNHHPRCLRDHLRRHWHRTPYHRLFHHLPNLLMNPYGFRHRVHSRHALQGTKLGSHNRWRSDAHHRTDVVVRQDGARLVALHGAKRLRVVEAARGGEVAFSVIRAVVASGEDPCVLGRAVKQLCKEKLEQSELDNRNCEYPPKKTRQSANVHTRDPTKQARDSTKHARDSAKHARNSTNKHARNSTKQALDSMIFFAPTSSDPHSSPLHTACESRPSSTKEHHHTLLSTQISPKFLTISHSNHSISTTHHNYFPKILFQFPASRI